MYPMCPYVCTWCVHTVCAHGVCTWYHHVRECSSGCGRGTRLRPWPTRTALDEPDSCRGLQPWCAAQRLERPWPRRTGRLAPTSCMSSRSLLPAPTRRSCTRPWYGHLPCAPLPCAPLFYAPLFCASLPCGPLSCAYCRARGPASQCSGTRHATRDWQCGQALLRSWLRFAVDPTELPLATRSWANEDATDGHATRVAGTGAAATGGQSGHSSAQEHSAQEQSTQSTQDMPLWLHKLVLAVRPRLVALARLCFCLASVWLRLVCADKRAQGVASWAL